MRWQVGYKTPWNGGKLVVADRWYPSSKTCSNCTTTKANLSLRERVFNCGACDLVMDRDENAARNLATLVADVVTGTAVGGDPEVQASKAGGAGQKTRARKNRQTSWSAGSQRAGGATPREGTETGHRTGAAMWPPRAAERLPGRTFRAQIPGQLIAAQALSNGIPQAAEQSRTW
ncbi:zinc ribbon domain-containing protein [Streptomyces sp. NPDC059215]|uniref:zinc ribbon domain-containing protein n=1 Tax=Streptomyces sp. NPDC059215 TaxID=3346772 RepID=UPI0036B18AC5